MNRDPPNKDNQNSKKTESFKFTKNKLENGSAMLNFFFVLFLQTKACPPIEFLNLGVADPLIT